MVRIPAWVWLAVALAAVLAVGVQQSMQAAYYRGIANDARERAVLQQSAIDSVVATSVELEEELTIATFVTEQQRLSNEREVTRLGLERIEARARSEAAIERLAASLDSAEALQLDSVVLNYEIEIAALDSIVVEERAYRMAESLRADAASELVLGLRSVITEHEALLLIRDTEIKSLRAAMKPSLGLRLKADWWLGAAGVAAGYLIWGQR
jgi:hypothetical protein